MAAPAHSPESSTRMRQSERPTWAACQKGCYRRMHGCDDAPIRCANTMRTCRHARARAGMRAHVQRPSSRQILSRTNSPTRVESRAAAPAACSLPCGQPGVVLPSSAHGAAAAPMANPRSSKPEDSPPLCSLGTGAGSRQQALPQHVPDWMPQQQTRSRPGDASAMPRPVQRGNTSAAVMAQTKLATTARRQMDASPCIAGEL